MLSLSLTLRIVGAILVALALACPATAQIIEFNAGLPMDLTPTTYAGVVAGSKSHCDNKLAGFLVRFYGTNGTSITLQQRSRNTLEPIVHEFVDTDCMVTEALPASCAVVVGPNVDYQLVLAGGSPSVTAEGECLGGVLTAGLGEGGSAQTFAVGAIPYADSDGALTDVDPLTYSNSTFPASVNLTIGTATNFNLRGKRVEIFAAGALVTSIQDQTMRQKRPLIISDVDTAVLAVLDVSNGGVGTRDIAQFSQTSGGNGDALTLDPAGNLGLGTNSPLSKVHIVLSTADLEIVDSGTAGATQDAWVEYEVGGTTYFSRLFLTK